MNTFGIPLFTFGATKNTTLPIAQLAAAVSVSAAEHTFSITPPVVQFIQSVPSISSVAGANAFSINQSVFVHNSATIASVAQNHIFNINAPLVEVIQSTGQISVLSPSHSFAAGSTARISTFTVKWAKLSGR